MKNQRRVLTAQKKAAIAALHAGLSPEAAAVQAGYCRPDSAAQKLFRLHDDGSPPTKTVQMDLTRLQGIAPVDDRITDATPKQVLMAMLASPATTDTARMSTYRALNAIHEREKDQAKHDAATKLDEYDAACAVHRLLRMPVLSREEHVATAKVGRRWQAVTLRAVRGLSCGVRTPTAKRQNVSRS